MSRNFALDTEILEMIFQGVSDAILVVDRRQKVTAINPAAEAMLGWKTRDLDMLSCRVLGCQSPNGQPLCQEQCMALRTMESSLPIRTLPMLVKTADGEPVQVETNMMPIRTRGDRRNTTVAIFLKDRAQAMKYEGAIRDLTDDLAEKNLVLRGVSQALTTAWKLPLVSIQSAGQTLQSHFSPYLGEGGLRHVKRILSGAQELESVLAKLQAQLRSTTSAFSGRSHGPGDGN